MEDVDAATTSAMHMLLKEAAAEGITTLASSGCNGLGSASYPGGLAQLVSVAAAPGITPAATATDTGLVIGGTGTFYDNGTSYGPYGVNNGQASATFTLSAAGGDTIVAVYSGMRTTRVRTPTARREAAERSRQPARRRRSPRAR